MTARRTLLAVFLATSSTAIASPPPSPPDTTRTRVIDFADDIIESGDHDFDVEVTLGLEPGDAELLRTNPTNPRIIDLDRVHRRDCALDRIRGGSCVLRGFDEPVDVRIDVLGYGHARAQHGRVQMLDRIIDSADDL